MQLPNIALPAFIAGLCLATVYSVRPIIGSVLIVCLAGIVYIGRRKTGLLIFCTFFLLLLAANIRYSSLFPYRTDVADIDALAKKVMVSGEIYGTRNITGGRIQLDLIVQKVASKSVSILPKKSLRVRLYVEEGDGRFLPGDRIEFKSRLRTPRLFGTPGEFDWPRYLRSQGIDMTAWIKSADAIILTEPGRWTIQRRLSFYRDWVVRFIQTHLPEREALLVRALVLGEGRVIPHEIREVFARAGISHLFAISGLHFGIIGFLLYRALAWWYLRFPCLLEWQPPQRVLPWILLPILFGYAILTGNTIATRRAFFVALLGTVFFCRRYFVNPLQLLASLAFISLVINPLLLWQAGWQLSFAGAAGIVYCNPWINEINSKFSGSTRFFLQLFLVTMAASFFTFPLVLFNFHILSFAALFTNMIAVPWISFLALPAGVIAFFLVPIFPQASVWFFQFCGFFLGLLLDLVKMILSLPGMSGDHLFLNRRQLLFCLGITVATALVLKYRKKWQAFSAIVSILLAILLWRVPSNQKGIVTLTVFSVGQGESILLQNEFGQTVLIDGGGLYSDRFDVGERLLAPAFAELNVDHFDAVMLTHDHPDHRKGLLYVLDNYPVNEFIVGKPLKEMGLPLNQIIQENHLKIREIEAGWTALDFWQGSNLNVWLSSHMVKENNRSLVLSCHLESRDGFLLTGDLEEDGVTGLLKAEMGPISLLKLPHHGSKYSGSERLVEKFNPGLCIASSGYKNRYRLPADSLVRYLEKRHIPLFRTDQMGTLRASFVDGEWETEHWEKGLFR